MGVVDLVHDFSIDVSELDICVHAMLAKECHHRLEFQENALLIDLEVGFWFAEIV